jgi:hypothetical protein
VKTAANKRKTATHSLDMLLGIPAFGSLEDDGTAAVKEAAAVDRLNGGLMVDIWLGFPQVRQS